MQEFLPLNNGTRTKSNLFGLRLLKDNQILWNRYDCLVRNRSLRQYKNAFSKSIYETNESSESSTVDRRLTILLLCSEDNQIQILQQAARDETLVYWAWILPLSSGYDAYAYESIYFPVDSLVLELFQDGNISSYFLRDTWNPGPKLARRKLLFGYFYLSSSMDLECPIDNSSLNENKLYTEEDIPDLFGLPDPFGDTSEAVKDKSPLSHPDTFCLYYDSLFPDRRKNLSGMVFTITTVNDSRAHRSYIDEQTGIEVFTGYFGDLWTILANEMDFRFVITTPADQLFGAKTDNGFWNGLVGDLIAGRADIIVAQLSITFARSEVVDFTSVLLKFSYRIFARPSEANSLVWAAYTRPFTWTLWSATGILVVLFSITYSCYHKTKAITTNLEAMDRKMSASQNMTWKYHTQNRVWNPAVLGGSFFLILGAFTQQGMPFSPDHSAKRFIFWMIYATGVILYASYSGTLVSFLTVVNNQLGFSSLQQLLAMKDYKIGILKGSVLEEFFKNPNFREAWNKAIIPYEGTLSDSYENLKAYARKDSKFTYVGSYEVQRIDKDSACTFQAAKQQLLYNDGAMGFPKNSPYLPLFNSVISRMREGGILYKLKEKHYPEPQSCPLDSIQALGLKETFTAFIVLSFGVATSLCILGLEKLLFDKYSNTRKILILKTLEASWMNHKHYINR